jgi:hypothetical protein
MADRMIPIDDAIAHLKGKKAFLQGQLGIARIPLENRNERGKMLDTMIAQMEHSRDGGRNSVDLVDWHAALRDFQRKAADIAEMIEGLISEIEADAIGAGDAIA